MKDVKDAHDLLYSLAIYSTICGDGGPRTYRQRGKELPEQYRPGRYLRMLKEETRKEIIKAVNSKNEVAPWALKEICNEADFWPRLPPAPQSKRNGRR